MRLKKPLYEIIGFVFQDFMQYKLTLRHNVGFGDLSQIFNDDKIISMLPNEDVNLDQQIGREFDGVEFSIGQWQKIANARGLFSEQHKIAIFDEPTSALDAFQERIVLQEFLERTEFMTRIIVTLRIGSAQLADRIVVMDGGSIVEEGPHETLLMQKGKYAEMYTAQAKWYQ